MVPVAGPRLTVVAVAFTTTEPVKFGTRSAPLPARLTAAAVRV